jgi:hypothetical protein
MCLYILFYFFFYSECEFSRQRITQNINAQVINRHRGDAGNSRSRLVPGDEVKNIQENHKYQKRHTESDDDSLSSHFVCCTDRDALTDPVIIKIIDMIDVDNFQFTVGGIAMVSYRTCRTCACLHNLHSDMVSIDRPDGSLMLYSVFHVVLASQPQDCNLEFANVRLLYDFRKLFDNIY